jgi:glycosyltransferase involved in cell wall biosynthesis
MEGQPISIIEAMGFGNFIVTTNHAGIPDICCKKNSLFVQKRDSKSLFNGLLELSKSMNQLESISLKNLQCARKKFSEDGFISGILKIFNEK